MGLALSFILLVAAPAQAETVVFDTVHVGMSATAFDAELRDQRIEDDRARSLRSHLDIDYGNDDGIVTEDEYEAYRSAEVEDFNDQLGNPIVTGLFADIKVNTRGARAIEVTDLTLSDNVIGSVDDNDTVLRSLFARLVFSDTEKTRVNVSFEQDFRVPFRIIEMEWGTATFAGSGDWAIDPSTFVPADTRTFWEEDRLVVPYERTGELSNKSDPMRLDIVDTSAESISSGKEGKDSPGPSLVAFVAVLAGLLALLSGRRPPLRRSTPARA